MPKWKADKRLYLSEEGQVVGESAPGRKTLLCTEGAELTEETCKRYGLGPYAPAEEPQNEPEAEYWDDKAVQPKPRRSRKS